MDYERIGRRAMFTDEQKCPKADATRRNRSFEYEDGGLSEVSAAANPDTRGSVVTSLYRLCHDGAHTHSLSGVAHAFIRG